MILNFFGTSSTKQKAKCGKSGNRGLDSSWKISKTFFQKMGKKPLENSQVFLEKAVDDITGSELCVGSVLSAEDLK